MKRLVLLAALLLSSGAYAQPPQEVTADEGIKLDPGQSRTFEFDKPVEKFTVGVDGVVKVAPLTDRTFSIQALRPGEVLAIVYGKDGREIHRMNILVEGRMVKIYGQKEAGGTVVDFTSYSCTSTGCGRANPDIVRGPNKTTVTETHTEPNGNSVTFEREYR